MIRSKRLPIGLLNAWLVDQNIPSGNGNYRLRLWRDNNTALEVIKGELIDYLDEAFEDARQRIRRGFEDDLSPFHIGDPKYDPAASFPALLNRVTIQGYFGETLAVLAVEHWGAHGHSDWVAPAFLFRFHEQEFQHLDLINQRLARGEAYEPDATEERRPGRTGDDGLAFRINADNVITDVLTLEAKCLSSHTMGKIKDAHEKLADGPGRPSGIRELLELLSEYDTPEANMWKEALLLLWKEGYRTSRRHDGVAYACGNSPSQGSRVAWMPPDKPHPAYTVDRNLEGMEFQFEDLHTLINTLYRGG